ncbi:MAG: hypothetical protein U0271_05555 [Polyangiaceae bacterium]
MLLRRAGLLGSIIVATAWFTGCAGGEGEPREPTASDEAKVEKKKDAALIAQNLIQGKASALVFVDRVRPHPVGQRLMALGLVKDALSGTNIEPLSELDRVFVTTPAVSEQRAIVFAEHHLTPEQITDRVQAMVAKSNPPGEVLTQGPEWTVHVQKRGRSGVVAFLEPNYLVVVPDEFADRISAFENTGGLPDPHGEEAAELFAVDPATTLAGRGIPAIPASLTNLGADIFLRPDGGMTVDAAGQATKDSAGSTAASLTGMLDDAMSMDIGVTKLRAFPQIKFQPDGDKVVTHYELSADEVDRLITLGAGFIR